MQHPISRLITFIICLSLTPVVHGAKWPEIPESDRTLSSLPGHPNAPAVILLREGTVSLSGETPSSFIDVYTRIKILTEEGTDYGTISLLSSEYMRTKEIKGRTHLPSGEIVDLSSDASFTREYSEYYNTSVVSCALPQVVPGAIIEYRYRTYFDSFFYPSKWFFQSEIPTLLSRVTYELPRNIRFYPIEISPLRSIELQRRDEDSVKGHSVIYSMENVPPVPDEPSRYPFEDLSARVFVLPGADYRRGTPATPLFDTWDHLVEMVVGSREWGYTKARRSDSQAERKAKALGAGTSPLKSARAIHRWVRDEISVEPFVGISAGEHTLDQVVKDARGDHIEKALLLEAMFNAARINANIGWTNSRGDGHINQRVIDPGQFGVTLVVAQISGERVFLDPSDKRLAFGQVEPGVRGMPCLIVDKKKHEWITIPPATPDEATRHATIDLELGDDGALHGTGRLELTGYHAWRRLSWKDTADETQDAWHGWIEDRYPGFEIAEVEVTEDIPTTTVDVRWSMAVSTEEGPFDEFVLNPAKPLAIRSNPFTLPPERRLTPLQIRFPDIDRVTLNVTWPEGWLLDEQPSRSSITNNAGQFTTSASVDESARRATFERNMTISQTEFAGRQPYAELRDLYLAAVASDAEEVVLIIE